MVGYNAFPKCVPILKAKYSISLSKMVYQGHESFLSSDNPLKERYLGRSPSQWNTSSQYDAW